eukprot:tig00021289_g19953.t1
MSSDCKPLYARCKDNEEFWAPIVEKAYAKLHQCYETLISGFVGYAMKDLTGGSPHLEKWKPEEYENEKNPLNERAVELWQDLRFFIAQGCLMGCAFSYSGVAEAPAPGADGILRGHVYGLLALEEVPTTREGRRETLRMLHVRNPWGKKEWGGRWSDKSGEWSAFPAVATALSHKDEEDGAFWMEYRDFLRNYNTVYVCRLFPSDWSGMRVVGRFEGEMAGGSPAKGNADWVKNRQYRLSVKSMGPVKAVISLCQPDARILGQPKKFPLPFAFFVCRLSHPGERVSNVAALNQEMSSGTFKAGREVTWDGKLDPGDYAIIPMTFEKGTAGGASQLDAALGDMCMAPEREDPEPEAEPEHAELVVPVSSEDPSLTAEYNTEEKEAKMARVERILQDDDFGIDEGDEEQFGAIKPWLGTVQNMVPTGFKETRAMKEACDEELELEFVHGYRAHDARRNLFYLGSGTGDIEEIVYHAAALGIVYSGFRGESDDDMCKRKQRFFTVHDGTIIALAMHPKGQLVATGQVGKDGIIHVWDAKSMAVKVTLKGFHKRGVCALAFSTNGTRLASVGLDDDHTVAVWDWMKSGAKPLGSDKGDKNKILLAEFKPGSETEFVTVGAQHIKFWTIDGSGQPSGKLGSAKGKGISAQKAYHAVAWAKDVCVTGTTDGPLYKWQGGSAMEAVDAHKGPVFALVNTPDGGLVSGGKDGLVKFWTPDLKCTNTVDVGKLLSANPIGAFVGGAPAIRALHARGGTVLVGTQSSQILEIQGSSVSVFMAAHGASGTWKGQPASYQGEVWGLDVKPVVGKTKKRYVTCSDDKTVRVWSVQLKSCVAVGLLSAPAKRVAWSPDKRDLVCGLLAGEVEVLDAETMQERAKFKCATPNVAPGDISDIKFNPDGSVLAVASQDSFIYLFDVPAGYKPRSDAFRCPPKGKAHSGTVWHIDFSEDGQTLQASDNAGEILFCKYTSPHCPVPCDPPRIRPRCAGSVSSGMQITKVSGLRDTKWATQTCVLGWSVQGIYAPGLKLPDINAVDRANYRQCLAIGDDFRSVQLVRYPCITEDCTRRRYKGHSEHVTNVKVRGAHRAAGAGARHT